MSNPDIADNFLRAPDPDPISFEKAAHHETDEWDDVS